MLKLSQKSSNIFETLPVFSGWGGEKTAIWRPFGVGLFGGNHLSHEAAVGQGPRVAWQRWKICHPTMRNYGK